MTKIFFNKNKYKILFYILIFVILTFFHLKLINYAYDDAYIHFRIAENLLHEGVPYYNMGESVMASSSSVWTIVLFFIFLIFEVNIKAVAIFNALTSTLVIVLFSKIFKENLNKNSDNRYDYILTFLLLPLILNPSIGLMETSFALMILALGIYYFSVDKDISFLFLSIAVFVRLELVVFYFIFIFYRIIIKRFNFKILFYSISGSIPFVSYNYYFFGTIIPNTTKAKDIVYDITMKSTFTNMIPKFMGIVSRKTHAILIIMFIILLLFYVFRNYFNKYRVIHLIFISGLFISAAYVLKSVLLHSWYKPLYLVPIIFSIIFYLLQLNKKTLLLYFFLIYIPFSLTLIQVAYASVNYNKRNVVEHFKSGARVRKYLEVSKELYSKYPNSSLMTTEIGGIGFGFKGKIYDGVGLITPEALKYHPMSIPEERSSGTTGALPLGFVEEVSPDLIVSYDVFIEDFLRSDIKDDYKLIEEEIFLEEDLKITKKKNIWGSENLKIFIKKDK